MKIGVGLPDMTVKGHPELELPNDADNPVTITVCCDCGKLRTVLWLVGDRWYCSSCKATGETRPTLIPLS